jgi:hypothetical protein
MVVGETALNPRARRLVSARPIGGVNSSARPPDRTSDENDSHI